MGRAGWFTVTLAFLTLAATAAAGQVVEGPLGDPAAKAGALAQPAAKAARKPRRHADKAAAKPAAATADAAPGEASPPAPPAGRTRRASAPAADDPISYGFKWQGSNDTAEKTRVQNYNGDAAGTGAAVGLKLHF